MPVLKEVDEVNDFSLFFLLYPIHNMPQKTEAWS